jgi:Flp pilus assembly protein TadG
MTCARRRLDLHGDGGSVAVEVAVVAPAFVFLLLLVVFAGRVSEADANVRRATSEAARAASLRQHPSDARTDAETIAEANLSAAGVRCTGLTVDVDTDNLQPGGTVTVTVDCTTSMADVTLLGVPGSRTFSARAVEVIDRHRGDAT